MGLFNKKENDNANLPVWQEMKKLFENMNRSIFSEGSFHVTGEGPYYIEYVGFSTDYDAFCNREKFIKALYDGTPYDERKEALCYSLIHYMFGEDTSMPLSDSLIEEDITADENLETLRINYKLLSLRHWSTSREAGQVIAGYNKWMQRNQ